LKSSEEDLKKKERKSIALNANSSKANLSNHGDSDSRNDSPREEEMRLFVRHFNCYIQKNGLRRSDKNVMNSKFQLSTKVFFTVQYTTAYNTNIIVIYAFYRYIDSHRL